MTFEEGSSLTVIPDNAFDGCQDLNSVYFKGETAITSFGEEAFNECKDLTEIRFDNNTCDVAIGKYCFYKDYDFTGVFNGTEPAPLGSLGYGAFYKCESIADLHLGESCSEIGSTRSNNDIADVFSGCTSLRSCTVEEGNPEFSSADGVLFASSYNASVILNGNL